LNDGVSNLSGRDYSMRHGAPTYPWARLRSVGLATGATSRYIGFSCAAILVIVAFIPKYAALLLIMPQPVIGALMVFTASFMIAGGI
jgi:xanthine/uracil permease